MEVDNEASRKRSRSPGQLGEEDTEGKSSKRTQRQRSQPGEQSVSSDKDLDPFSVSGGGDAWKAYKKGEDPTGMIAAYSSNIKKRSLAYRQPIPFGKGEYRSMQNILTKICKMDLAEEVFQYPVDKKSYPEYYSMIEKPVCLQDIFDRLKTYTTLDEALADLNLVWSNAKLFNAEGSEIHVLADKFQKKSDLFIQDKFGAQLKAQSDEAEAKVALSGIAGGGDLNEAHKDIREPGYWPKDRDENGNPTGKLQIPKKLWTHCWKIIKDHPWSGPFQRPFHIDEFPGYMDKVSRPMDLESVNKIARSGVAYKCTDELCDLMYLIFDNAMAYYSEDTEIYQSAKALRKIAVEIFAGSQKAFENEVNIYLNTLAREKAKKELTEPQKNMMKVMKKLWSDERSLIFRELPEDLDRDIPGYTDVIARPIDLKSIMDTLWTFDGEDSNERFLSDVKLVFDNAMEYNKEGSEIFKNAQDLQIMAEKYYMKYVQGEDTSAVNRMIKQKTEALHGTTNADGARIGKTSVVALCQDAVKELLQSTDNKLVLKVGGKTVETTIEDSDLNRLEALLLQGDSCIQDLKDELMELPAIIQRCHTHTNKVRRNMDADSIQGTNGFSVACAMYDVVSWGDIGVMDSPDKAKYHTNSAIYPVGFEVARCMRLAVLPSSRAKPNSSVLDPTTGHSYPFIHIEMLSQVLQGDKGPLFNVTLSNGTLLASENDPRDAWQVALSHPEKIVSVLTSKLRRCRAVLYRLSCESNSETFLEELELPASQLAHYIKVVKAPMWLSEVHKRLVGGKYDNEYDFAWDMRTIFHNCIQYNQSGSELYNDAKELMSLFDDLFCEWVLNPVDISLEDVAEGPWDDWDYLRYFDSEDENYFCRISGEKAPDKSLVQCKMCEDQFLPANLKGNPKPKPSAKNWMCNRCINATGKFANYVQPSEHSPEAFGRYRWTTAASVGYGWCQAQERTQSGTGYKRVQVYLSPLGNIVVDKENISEQKAYEKEINTTLLQEREAEYREEKGSYLLGNGNGAKSNESGGASGRKKKNYGRPGRKPREVSPAEDGDKDKDNNSESGNATEDEAGNVASNMDVVKSDDGIDSTAITTSPSRLRASSSPSRRASRTGRAERNGTGTNEVSSTMDDGLTEPGIITPGELSNLTLRKGECFVWFVCSADVSCGTTEPAKEDKGPRKEDRHLSLFKKGDKVMADYRQSGKWYPGQIHHIYPDATYHVKFDDGDEEKHVALARLGPHASSSPPRTFYTKYFRGLDHTEEALSSPCRSVSDWVSIDVKDSLPLTGYFGLHLKEIRRYIEADLDENDELPGYEFASVIEVFTDYLQKIRTGKSTIEAGREDARSPDERFRAKVHSELEYWNRLRIAHLEKGHHQRSNKIDVDANKTNADEAAANQVSTVVDRGLDSLRRLFEHTELMRTLPDGSEGALTRQQGELMLCIWDFLDYARPVIGDAVLGFEDLVRSLVPKTGSLPWVNSMYFDEICTMMTQFLLRELRVKMGFDGLKQLSDENGQDTSYRHSKTSLQGLPEGGSEADHRYTYTMEDNAVRKVQGEIHWQELLLYRPLNAYSWPAVLRNVLLVIASPKLGAPSARMVAKFPGVEEGILENDFMCLICAHPLSGPFIEEPQMEGCIVMDVEKESTSISKKYSKVAVAASARNSMQCDADGGTDEDTDSDEVGPSSEADRVEEMTIHSKGSSVLLDGYDPPMRTSVLLQRAPMLLSTIRENVVYKSALYNGCYYPNKRCFIEDLLACIYLNLGFSRSDPVPTVPDKDDENDPYRRDHACIPDELDEDGQYKQFCALQINFFIFDDIGLMSHYNPKEANTPGVPIFNLLEHIYRIGCVGRKYGRLLGRKAPDGLLEREMKRLDCRTPGCFMANLEYRAVPARKDSAIFHPDTLGSMDGEDVEDLCGVDYDEEGDEAESNYMAGGGAGKVYDKDSARRAYRCALAHVKRLGITLSLLRSTEPEELDFKQKMRILQTLYYCAFNSQVTNFLRTVGKQIVSRSGDMPGVNISGEQVDAFNDLLEQARAAVASGDVKTSLPETLGMTSITNSQSGNISSSGGINSGNNNTAGLGFSTDSSDTSKFVIPFEVYRSTDEIPGRLDMTYFKPKRKENQGTRCFFSGLSATMVDPKYQWVELPAWATIDPVVSNFGFQVDESNEEIEDFSSTLRDMQSQSEKSVSGRRGPKIGAKPQATRKHYAIEHLAYIVLSARYIALKAYLTKANNTAKYMKVIVCHDSLFRPTLPETSYSERFFRENRGRPIGEDAAGWQYWLLGVQRRASVRTIGFHAATRDRQNNEDHEPTLLIRPNSATESWYKLEIGSRPSGINKLLKILQQSDNKNEQILRQHLLERLVQCRADAWDSGCYTGSQYTREFYARKMECEMELLRTREAILASGELSGMSPDEFGNACEVMQAKCQELRALTYLGWLHAKLGSSVSNVNHKEQPAARTHLDKQNRDSHVEDALDYHPSRGYLRNDSISRLRMAQPSITATRIAHEPHFAEWVRYSIRRRGFDLSQAHRMPYLSTLPPAFVVDLPEEILRVIFQSPTKALEDHKEILSEQKRIESDSSVSMATKIAEAKESIISRGVQQPKCAPFVGKYFKFVLPAPPTEESDKTNADAMDIDEDTEVNNDSAASESGKNEIDFKAESKTTHSDNGGDNKNIDSSAKLPVGELPPPIPDGCLHVIGQELKGSFICDGLTTFQGQDLFRGYGFSKAVGKRYTKVIELRHFVTGEVLRVFESQTTASEYMNISKSGISLCCSGKQTDANGFQWRFYEGQPIDFDALYASGVLMPKDLIEKLRAKGAWGLKASECTPDSKLGKSRIIEDMEIINTFREQNPQAYGPGNEENNARVREALEKKKAALEETLKKEKEELAKRSAEERNAAAPTEDASTVRSQYIVKKRDGNESKHYYPRTDEWLHELDDKGTKNLHMAILKPQMSLTSNTNTSARMLALKAELSNLVMILPDRLLDFDNLREQIASRARAAAAAEKDESRFECELNDELSDEEDDGISAALTAGGVSQARGIVIANGGLSGPHLRSMGPSSVKASIKGLNPSQMSIHFRMPMKPRQPVPVYYGECTACVKHTHTAHTRVRDCRLSGGKEASDKRVADDEANYKKDFEKYTIDSAIHNRLLVAIYLGKKHIEEYSPGTEIPGVVNINELVAVQASSFQNNLRKKNDAYVKAKADCEKKRTELSKLSPAELSKLSEKEKLVPADPVPPNTVDTFADVIDIDIRAWNVTHGMYGDVDNIGKKKKKCDNCRPNRNYICGRCKAEELGLAFDRKFNQQDEFKKLPTTASTNSLDKIDSTGKDSNNLSSSDGNGMPVKEESVSNTATATDLVNPTSPHAPSPKAEPSPLSEEALAAIEKKKEDERIERELKEAKRKEEEAAEKERRDRKERREARRLKRRKQVLDVLKMIKEAVKPRDLMVVLCKVEEMLPEVNVQTYHKYAMPYSGEVCATVALRLFALDRVINYNDIKGVETEAIGRKKTFKFRTQLSPRCLARSECCGPLWHPGPCVTTSWYFLPTIKIGGFDKKKGFSRQPGILDISGDLYVPEQGIEATDEALSRAFSTWKAKRDEERKRKAAELGAARRNGRLDSDDESEFSEDRRKKENQTRKINVDIEWVQPYRPTNMEVSEFYDI